jgi:signal recognition particle subunit SRP54
MFDNLSSRLSEAARSLSGRGRLTDSNIKDTLRQVRLALLEADVALPVVKGFIERIRERAVGEEVGKSLTPGQALVKIIHAELVQLLGGQFEPLDFKAQPPVVVLLAGLQGAGKTTTVRRRSCSSRPWLRRWARCTVRAAPTKSQRPSWIVRSTQQNGRMPTS